MAVAILSGGAANGLVNSFRDDFRSRTGEEIEGDFGAVGAMKDRVANGEHVDLVILTRAAVDELVSAGRLDGASVTDLGRVATGIAVRDGARVPDVGNPAALGDVLQGADALYCPDTAQATAGIHFARVLAELGLADALRDRLREFPNGQTAMAEMARGADTAPVGCTQMTEILNTPGVTYAGPLPEPLGLSTVYTAAVATGAALPEQARALVALMADPDREELRRSVGFT